jgi:hypothetical protein
MVKKNVNKKEVYDWIRTKISKRNPKVGKAICPYAKTTLETEKIEIVYGKPNLVDQINHCCNLLNTFALDCIIILIQHKITEAQLSKVCKTAQIKNPYRAIMYDHPTNDGKHCGVSFSFGKAPLIMIQDLAKLKKMQKIYKAQGWYDAWNIKDTSQFY